jgi:hypothetical protein
MLKSGAPIEADPGDRFLVGGEWSGSEPSERRRYTSSDYRVSVKPLAVLAARGWNPSRF